MREVVDDSEDKIDDKVDKEVEHLKESICDKIDALKSAVVGLKDLTVEKIKSAEKDLDANKDKIRYLREEAEKDHRRTEARTRSLENKILKLEEQLAELEKAVNASGYMMADDFGMPSVLEFEDEDLEEIDP